MHVEIALCRLIDKVCCHESAFKVHLPIVLQPTVLRPVSNRPFAANDHVVQKSAMLADKLIIIPALGHQNKGKSSFTDAGLFV